MKREINAKKINSNPKPKKTVSAAKTPAKKTQASEKKHKTAVKEKPKAKKSFVKNLTIKTGTKKEKAASGNSVKQTLKKKSTATKPKSLPKTKVQVPVKLKKKPAAVATSVTKRKKESLPKVKTAAPKQIGKLKTQKKPALINRADKPIAKKIQASKKTQSSSKIAVSKTKKPVVLKVKGRTLKTKNKPTVKIPAVNPKPSKRMTLNSKAISKPKAASKIKAQKPVKTKPVKQIKVEKAKPKAKKIESKVSVKKPKTTEKRSKTVITAKPKSKPQKRIVKPISSAVFRGKDGKYDFKVFPLDEKFENVQAVYIISKRKTDKRKRGHHALICIGATDALADEIKKHRKGKSLRQKEANVISILAEADAQRRLKIERDLKAAHSISCNHG